MTSAPLFASPALAGSPSASASASAAAADEAIPPELLAEGRGDLIDDRALLNYHLELRTVKKLVVEERRPTAGDDENGDDDLYGDRRRKVRETTVEILVPRRNDRDVMEALHAAEDPSEAAEFEAALQLLFAKAVLGEEHAVDEEEFDDELLLREVREQMEREQQQEQQAQQRRQQAEEQERATPPPPPAVSVAAAATPTVKHVTLVDPRATPADSRRHPSSAFAGKTPQERAARDDDDDDDDAAAAGYGGAHALPAASATVVGASPAAGAARSSPHRHISPQQLRNKRRELQREREQHAQRVVQQALALADDIDTTSMIINTPEQLLRRQQRGLLQQQEAAARGETGGGSSSGGGIHHRVSAMLKLMYRDIESRQWRFETEKAIMAHKAQLEEEQRRLREQGRAVGGGAAMSPGSPGGNSNNNRGSAASAGAVDAHSLAAGGSGDAKDVSDALIDQLGNSSGIDQSVMSLNSNSTPARAGRQRRRRTVVVRHAKKPPLPTSAETPAESNLDASMTTTTALASPLDASVSGGGAAATATEYVEEYEEVEEDEEEDGEGGDRSGASPAHQQHHNRFGSPGAGSLAGAASAAALAQRMRASIGAGRRAGPGGLLGGGSIGPGSGVDGGTAGGRRASDQERGVFASLFHELKAFQQAERSGGGSGGDADGRAPRPAPKQIQEMLDAYLAKEENRKRHRPLSYADDDLHGAASVVALSTHRSERGGSSPLDERSNSNINSPSASRKRYAMVASPKRALACINAIEEVEANLARATRNLAAVTHKTPFTGTLPPFVVGPDNARVDRQEYLQELVQAKRSRLAENYAHRAEDPLSDPLHRGNHIRRLQEMSRKKQLQDARFRRRLERMQEEMRRQGKVVSTLEHEGYNDDDDDDDSGGGDDRNELSGGDAGSGEFEVGRSRARSPAEQASEDATKFTSQKQQPQHRQRRDSSAAHTSDPGLPIVHKFRERTKMAFGRKAASAHIGPDSLFYTVDKLQRARDKEDEAGGGAAKKQKQTAARSSKTGAEERLDASVASGAALPPLQSGGWWQEQQSKNPDAVPPREAYDAPLSLSAVAAASPAVGALTPVKRRAIASKTPTPLSKNRTPLRNSSSTAGATPSPAAASDAAATPSAARRYFELSKPVDRRFVKM
jgi:hypothetical protein